MASSEGTGHRRRAARKANGSGTIKKRKDGRYEGQVFVRTTSGEFKRVSVYGRSWDECDDTGGVVGLGLVMPKFSADTL